MPTITELIAELQEMRCRFGDLSVGIYNQEFATYETISIVERKLAVNDGSMHNDATELGEKFIGLL